MKNIFIISLFTVLVIGAQSIHADPSDNHEINYQWVDEDAHAGHGKKTFTPDDTFDGLKSAMAREAKTDSSTMKIYGPDGEEIKTKEQFKKALEKKKGKEPVELTIRR